MAINRSNNVFQRLDLALLKYFFAVASFGGFSKASRATGVSQPALSLGLQKLERTLGARLIDRKSGQFALTESGLVLDAFCKRLEGGLESMLNDLGGERPIASRRLRIGTALSIGFEPLVKACIKNALSNLPMELELTAQNTFQLLNAVKDGQLESALVPDDVYDRNLLVTPLFKDKLVFVRGTSQERLFRGKDPVSAIRNAILVTYPRETPMRSLVDQLCGQHHLRFKSVVSVNGLDAIVGLVKNGAGGAFVLKSLVGDLLKERELQVVKFPFSLPSSGVVLVTAGGEHGRHMSRVMKKFLGIRSE